MTAPKMPMTSDWLTAREIAELGLRDLPTTERRVIEYAMRNGWNTDPARCRNRRGRGGGLEYHVSLLPTLARMQFEQRTMTVGAVEPVRPVPSLPVPETERARRAQDARLAILTAWDRYGSGLALREAGRAHAFASAYTMGHVRVDDWVRAEVPALSARTLFRWRGAARAGKAIGSDPGLARKGKGVFDLANGGAVSAWIMGLVALNPALSASQIETQLRGKFGDELELPDGELVPVPSTRTLQHWIRGMKATEQVALTQMSAPDTYRSRYRPSGTGSLAHISEPNALWMIDASPVDALCTDGRHSIYGVIDIATRRTLWYVSRTPRAAAVGLLIRKAVLAWGVPHAVKTDNGSDFKANATVRLFDSLGVEIQVSDAYQPQQKGHIERAIKTFQHDCAALLPGYIGHSVAERKNLEDRKSFAARREDGVAASFAVTMTGTRLQDYADRWARDIYEVRGHAGLKGKSPAEVARASTAPIRTVEERALDILLMPIATKGGIRTVTKFGIRISDHHYVIQEALPGDRVLVRLDPMDAGRAHAFDADSGRYVGEAICASIRGVSPVVLLSAKRKRQSEKLHEKTARPRKAQGEILGTPMIETALAVAERDKPNVIPLPKRTVEHETPAIAAAKSVAARKPGTPAPLSGRAAELHAELTREAIAPAAPAPAANVRPLRTQETKQQRFRRALDIERQLAAGADVPAEDAVWLGGYRAGSEYRAMRTLYEDGGERVLR